jgi:hypothetical protein
MRYVRWVSLVLAVMIGLVSLWQMSRNGHYQVVSISEAKFMVINTRTGNVMLKAVTDRSTKLPEVRVQSYPVVRD